MADYYRPKPGNPKLKKSDSKVQNIVRADPEGAAGQEGALLNGLIAMGYDPALVRSLADADPNRRYLDDAITRALRAGVVESDIKAALNATRLAASGDPQGALKALNRDRSQLPPEAAAAYDAFANRQPLPFLDRGQTTRPGAEPMGPHLSEVQRPEVTGPPGSTHYQQQRGGERVPSPQAPAQKAAGGPGAGAGAGAGAGGGGGGGLQGLPANANDAQIEAYFRKNYGAEAWMIAIPDFKKIMSDVAHNPSGWSPESITSALQQTPWWQSNGQNVASYLELKANSPKQFEAAIKTKADDLRSRLTTYGITISDDRLNQIANEAQKWGWDDATINQAVSQEFDYTEGQHGVFVDKLKNEAKSYLTPVSEGTIDLWGRKLIADPNEQGNWQEFLKEQAKGMFPAFANRLDGGENMEQITKPYAASAAQLLEMDEGDIDFMDPKWMKALDQSDDKGNHSYMSPADWRRTLMTDPTYRYDHTEQAKQSAVGLATDIMKKFGIQA